MATRPVKPETLAGESSSKKLKAAHLFEQVAVAVSDGSEYGLHELLRSQATLSQARAAWKPMNRSLAAVVIDEREHA